MIGTIKLYGDQRCGYLYAVTGEPSASELALAHSGGACPPWGLATQFRVNFSNELVAGNASFGSDPPTEYSIYRQKDDEDLVFAGVIDGDETVFEDYAIVNNAAYKYYIYPSSTTYVGTPIVTASLSTDWEHWILMVVDPTTVANRYTIGDVYYFEFNIGDTSLQNNTSVNILRTFTPYMKIQKCSTNSWSGSLSALLGVLDATTGDYYETVSMADAIKTLSTDTRPKFLRDMYGHIYKIDISSAITLNTQHFINSNMSTKQLTWQETGDATGVIITGVNT